MGTKLVKSSRDKKIMGVCGGIAEYLHIDSTIVRIIWALAACCFGSGILLYFIIGIIMPQDNFRYNNYNNYGNTNYRSNDYSYNNYSYNSIDYDNNSGK